MHSETLDPKNQRVRLYSYLPPLFNVIVLT
jgi:hypothetical protein